MRRLLYAATVAAPGLVSATREPAGSGEVLHSRATSMAERRHPAERGAASQATLGRRLSIDRSDMHAVLSDLERDGFVARGRDANDRRRNVVDLTRTGARALKRLDKRVEGAQEALIAPLSTADRRQLHRLLTRLAEHHSGQRATRG